MKKYFVLFIIAFVALLLSQYIMVTFGPMVWLTIWVTMAAIALFISVLKILKKG